MTISSNIEILLRAKDTKYLKSFENKAGKLIAFSPKKQNQFSVRLNQIGKLIWICSKVVTELSGPN